MSESPLEALLRTYAIEAHHVLVPKSDVLEAARQLRTRAQPGARVLLAQRPPRSPWARLKTVWNNHETDADTVEILAGSLLAAGLEAPQLAAETRTLIAVCARVPSLPDPLDEVFLRGPSNL